MQPRLLFYHNRVRGTGLQRPSKSVLRPRIRKRGQSTNLDKGCWESEAFREEILELLKQRLRGANNRHYQRRRQADHHTEAQTMALTQSAKEILALNDQDLTGSRRVDAQMLERCAWAIARSTAVSQAWITHKLGTRSAANVSQQIRRFESNRDRQIDARIQSWIDFVIFVD